MKWSDSLSLEFGNETENQYECLDLERVNLGAEGQPHPLLWKRDYGNLMVERVRNT